MSRIEFSKRSLAIADESATFVILGSDRVKDDTKVKRRAMNRISKKTETKVNDFWGTLGYANDLAIDWGGYINVSSFGNKDFAGVVSQEVEFITQCYPNLKRSKSITERYIDLRNLEIPFPDVFLLEEIPKLRLDVMLGKDEGAIVFYQNNRNSNKANYVEYIQPQPTDSSNSVDQRDRLKYIFEAIPKYEIVPVDDMPNLFKLGVNRINEPFIIKVITFKRPVELAAEGELTSHDVVTSAHNQIAKGIVKYKYQKPHNLLVFSRSKNQFVLARANDIKTDKRTLLLIHGTFSDTHGSFGDLYKKKNSVLSELSDSKYKNHYEQIIAFDHPTLFMGAQDNIDELFKCMNVLNIGSFKSEVDVMGTSQGGLLVQYLANLNQDRIKVGKAVLIASANGVGYLSAGEHISMFLSVLRKVMVRTGKAHLAMVSALAQHSIDFLLKQPGIQIMTPNHDRLNEIICKTPVSKQTSYLPLIDAYDKSIVSARFRVIERLKRLGAEIIYAGTKPFLGNPNDWVVGTKNQFLVPSTHCAIPNYNPGKFREHTIKSIHGACLNKPEAQKSIKEFLLRSVPPKNADDSSGAFDAHFHVFGRNIITGRILLMLIEDLVNLKKQVSTSVGNKELPVFIKSATVSPNDDTDEKSGSALVNILTYFALYKDSKKVLNALEKEYYKLNSNVYRYVPLMFDVEMTFRGKYFSNDFDHNASTAQQHFLNHLKDLLKDVDNLIEQFEQGKNLMFVGSSDEKLENVKVLKSIRRIVKVLDVDNPQLNKHTKNSYFNQIEEIKMLKNWYGSNMLPFLAVDPRRDNMAQIITDNVGEGKPFHGIKLYPPNGYSPTDPNLFDDSQRFIDGGCLYSYCIKNNIPIITHCSNAGFATFVEELEIWGDIYNEKISGKDKLQHFGQPTAYRFNSNNPFSFYKAVRERAMVLNHPAIWQKVLAEHKQLKICFAHFGGESDEWREQLFNLITNDNNAYTDLSCITSQSRLKTIREKYFISNPSKKHKIMYGSDFYFNMLGNISFEAYYKHFRDTFTETELKQISVANVEHFLGISGV